MLPRHLYVHAAFCARRCSYCDFAVHVATDPPVAAWSDAIGTEMRAVAAERGWEERLPLETLYLGGGTPSLLGPEAVPRLIERLAESVDLGGLEEFTAEANPESLTREVAESWARSGVDRISFGAQTFHPPTLRWMGRLHGPEGPERAVRTARAAGIGNIGLDLIFGVPERLERDLDQDLDRLLELAPDHISIYGLTVEEGTPLGRWVSEGREVMPEQERYRDEYLRVADRLGGEGYEHYEVSNFARPGRGSRHNAAYWRGVSYLGLGNGAHSFVSPERWWNRRDWHEYRTAVASGGTGREGSEHVSAESRRLEEIWLGLRTRDGVSWPTLTGGQAELAQEWLMRGLAERVGQPGRERLRLTVEGWLLLDRLTVQLDEAAAVAS